MLPIKSLLPAAVLGLASALAGPGGPAQASFATTGHAAAIAPQAAVNLSQLPGPGGLSPLAVSTSPRPVARIPIPVASWDHRREGRAWSRAVLAALAAHGRPLSQMVPQDVATWCPGYRTADEGQRRAFWVGFLSTLAKHESTWRPTAVGGGGLWYGLTQILPGTARGYGCRARNGEALKNGAMNLSCAVRIMAVTVPRDGVISAGMRGVAADWGPLHSAKKRTDMINWVRRQEYCQINRSPRPQPRPAHFALNAFLDELKGTPLRPRPRPEGPATAVPVLASAESAPGPVAETVTD